MRKTVLALLLVILLPLGPANSLAEGLPVAKYLEDPEHKDEIISFYLSSVFTGINLVNSRIKPPLFCLSDSAPESAFAIIDNRINKMQNDKKLTEGMTVDSIIMDILISEFPCR